jgi:hypothetical protein
MSPHSSNSLRRKTKSRKHILLPAVAVFIGIVACKHNAKQTLSNAPDATGSVATSYDVMSNVRRAELVTGGLRDEIRLRSWNTKTTECDALEKMRQESWKGLSERDPWGREHLFTCVENRIVVRSKGKDGIAESNDDVVNGFRFSRLELLRRQKEHRDGDAGAR